MWKNKYPFQYMQRHTFNYSRPSSVLNVFYLIKSIENSIEFGNENPDRPFICQQVCGSKHKLNLFINFFNKEIYNHIRDDKDSYRTLEPNTLLGELDYHFSLQAYDTLKELLHFLNRTIVKIQNIGLQGKNLGSKQINNLTKYTFPSLIFFLGIFSFR